MLVSLDGANNRSRQPVVPTITPAASASAKSIRSSTAALTVEKQSSQPIYPLRSTAALTVPREFNFNTSKRKREGVALPSQPPARQIPTRAAPPAKVTKVLPSSSVRSQPPRVAKAAALPKVSHFAATTASRGSVRRSPIFARLAKPKGTRCDGCLVLGDCTDSLDSCSCSSSQHPPCIHYCSVAADSFAAHCSSISQVCR